MIYDPVKIRKAELPEFNYVTRSSLWLSNHTWSEARHNVSVHQLPLYYAYLDLPDRRVSCNPSEIS